MKKTSRGLQLLTRATVALLVGVGALLLWAHAVHADTLTLGSHYNTITFSDHITEGGGSISPVYLNGQALAFIYCVDVNTNISVPASYFTYVSNDGFIHKTSTSNGTVVTNANQVAWLVETYGIGADTAPEQMALQAAIWHVIYGGFTPSDADVKKLYNTYLDALGTTTVSATEYSHVTWLSPVNGQGSPLQGQVILTTPELSSTLLLAVGLLGFGGFSWRRRII